MTTTAIAEANSSRRPIALLTQWFRDRPLVAAGVEAVVVGATALISLWLQLRVDEVGGFPDAVPFPLAVAWTLALVVPFTLRRLWPLGSFTVVGLVFAGYRLWMIPEYMVSAITIFLSLMAAGERGGRRRTPVRAAVCAVILVVYLIGVFTQDLPDEYQPLFRWNLLISVGYNVWFFAAAWTLGDLLRRRKVRERELELRTKQLETEREENARRAVLDERLRIARELHDVVAHHVSVMGVQAGAARRVLGREPARATAALATVEASSRQAVDELRRLVGFLRDDEVDINDLAPTPGLERLDTLVAETRSSTDLDVGVEADGDLVGLPASLSRSAYRVVQEALTNTIKHAHARRVTIALHHEGGDLVVEVRDDGIGLAAPPLDGAAANGLGHGLTGMRERVALHEGQLMTGRHPDGGYRVRACFPVTRGNKDGEP
ncbi:MAG: sensor histidine kinase [Desertimonas sp.]